MKPIDKLALINPNNPYLINIKKRKQELLNKQQDKSCITNELSKKGFENKKFNYDNFDKENTPGSNNIIKYITETKNQLIDSLAHALNCTFFNDTVFKLFVNMDFYGIKCMVIKKRNKELEYNNPDCLLEWETIYSETKNEFDIVYFLYNPVKGIIFYIDLNKNVKEIATGVILDKENRFHINSCINIFRDFYIRKNNNQN